MPDPKAPELRGLDFLDALNRGAAEAYADPIQREVLDAAIKARSHVAPSRSTRSTVGPSIRDAFAPPEEPKRTGGSST